MAKGKMKKIILSILVGLLVLILAGVLIFKLFGNQMIRAGIVAGAEKALQVDVRLGNVNFKLLAGKTELKNLEIDNPKDYKHPTFLKLGRAYADLNTGSLFSDTIEINKIQLDDIAVVIEQNKTTSNLKEILDNLPKDESVESQPESESKPAPEEAGKNLLIKVLEINNVEVKAKLLPIPGRADTVTFKLKPIRLENVGSEEKINAAGLTAKVINAIAGGIVEQGSDLLPTEMVGSVTKELGKQGQALVRAGEGLIKDGADTGKEATEAVKEGLGGLFKKKDP